MDKQPNDRLINERPIPAVLEEIGVDYIYRCGYVKCEETIHRYYNYCPFCGTKIDWSEADVKKLRNRYKRRNKSDV